MASILSSNYDTVISADLVFDLPGFINYGRGMQKSVRGNFFKFPDLEPNYQTINAKKFLKDFDAICMASPSAWVEFVKTFMILKPGRDHLNFNMWDRYGNRRDAPQARFQIDVWRYGHRAKKTPMTTTTITVQSTDKIGKDIIWSLFDNYTENYKLNVDIK